MPSIKALLAQAKSARRILEARNRALPTDPVEYAAAKGLRITAQQARILQALTQPPYSVLVRAAHAVGKTFIASLAASWFYDTHNPGIILTTAPTHIQVADLLFKELRNVRKSDPHFLPKATRLEENPNHFIHGLTANKADAFQGRHGTALMVVFDEAAGVEWVTPSSTGVTSVALSAPAIFSVSGSPVTSSGTLGLSLASQTANYVWAGPTTGAAAAPTFRALVAGDIPALSYVSSSGGTVSGNLTVTGNLTIQGTTTTVSSTTLTVADKNIELATGSSTDTAADGGGLTLHGATDKTLNWVNATGAWTSSEHLDLASGKALKINGTTVLSATTLDGVSIDGGTF